MKRVMLVVAYDGTNYCGWQIQANGITVQEELKPLPVKAAEGAYSDCGSQPDRCRRPCPGMWRYLILRPECRRKRFPMR